MKVIYKIIATFFGAGYAPFAPGTVGALFGCGFLYFFEYFNIISFYQSPIILLIIILIATILGIISTNKLIPTWGKDPSKVVIDEAVGIWVSMLFIPFNWINLLIAFVLFRFFDIAKPLGIRKLENLHGGIGVMADDILAGVYSNILLQIIITFVL